MAVQFQYFEPKAEIEADVINGTKNILWFVKYYGDIYFPSWLRKPLYDCPRCMASIHSTYVYFLFGQELIYYPVYILMLSGMIEIVVRKFEI